MTQWDFVFVWNKFLFSLHNLQIVHPTAPSVPLHHFSSYFVNQLFLSTVGAFFETARIPRIAKRMKNLLHLTCKKDARRNQLFQDLVILPLLFPSPPPSPSWPRPWEEIVILHGLIKFSSYHFSTPPPLRKSGFS